MALVVKNLPANAGDLTDVAVILPGEAGRRPRAGNGNPLTYSCMKNPKDRGDPGGRVHRADICLVI